MGITAGVLITIVALSAQVATQRDDGFIGVEELCLRRSSLKGKVVRLKGIMTVGHSGVLIKDEKETLAVPLFLRRRASKVIPKDDALYREVLRGIYTVPPLGQPRQKYWLKAECLVSVLNTDTYKLNTEYPLKVHLVRILQFAPLADELQRDKEHAP